MPADESDCIPLVEVITVLQNILYSLNYTSPLSISSFKLCVMSFFPSIFRGFHVQKLSRVIICNSFIHGGGHFLV